MSEFKSLVLDNLMEKAAKLPEGTPVKMTVAELATFKDQLSAEIKREYPNPKDRVPGFDFVPDTDPDVPEFASMQQARNSFEYTFARMPKKRRELLKRHMQAAISMSPEDRRKAFLEPGEEGSRYPISPRIQADATNNTGVDTGLGLVPYALESPAYYLQPVITPLGNELPRRVVGGTGIHFKRIMKIDTQGGFGLVREANGSTMGRADFLKFNEQDDNAAWATIGLDDFYTEQARIGQRSTVDNADFGIEALATLACMQGARIRQERGLLGMNKTALGAPTGLARDSSTEDASGSLTAATPYYIRVSALTYGGLSIYGANGNDGTNDSLGESTACVEITVTTQASSNGSKCIGLKWNAVLGAVAYNVYAAGTTGAEKLIATVNVNRYLLGTVTPSVNHSPNTADQTADGGWSGLIEMFQRGGGYVKSLDNAKLTGDNKTGVTQIDDMFKYMFDTYFLSPTVLRMGTTERKNIDTLVLGSSAPVMRVQLQDGDRSVVGGIMVSSLLNRYTEQVIDIRTHPFMPQGTILGQCESFGENYPSTRIPNPIEVLLGWDFTRFDFARRGLLTEFGVYMYGAPVGRALFPMTSISNVNASV